MSPEQQPVTITPDHAHVGGAQEVAEFGLNVADPGPYAVVLEGSAGLAATLVDQDGVTVSATEDGAGANPLRLEAMLAPGAYTLRVRAARKGDATSVTVRIEPA